MAWVYELQKIFLKHEGVVISFQLQTLKSYQFINDYQKSAMYVLQMADIECANMGIYNAYRNSHMNVRTFVF